jgi:hypothetical protein
MIPTTINCAGSRQDARLAQLTENQQFLWERTKMSYDFAALERRFYKTSKQDGLTPEVLGKIIASAWKRTYPENNTFLSYDELTRLVINHIETAPQEVKDILHFDRRPDGVRIEEMTRLIVGAQNAGFLVRANPQNVYTHIKADLMETYTMLDTYGLDFPSVVTWAQTLAKNAPKTE